MNRKLEEIHSSLYDIRTFNPACSIPIVEPSFQAINFASPSKSTANSIKSLRSPGDSNSEDGGSGKELVDFDNISVFSGKSFISNSSSASQNSNYSEYL